MAASNTKKPVAGADPAADAAAAAPVGVLFVSPHASLVVYHKDKKIAEFSNGQFRTDDDKIIAVLREHELVQESEG
jgi:hypothetical protein